MRSRDGWAGLALLLLLLPTGCRHTSLLPLPDPILGKQVAVLLSQPSLSPQLVFPRSFSCGLSGQSSLRIAFLSTAVPADPSDPWPRLCCSALQSVLPFPGSPVPAPAPVSVTGKGGLCPSRVLPARRDGERLFVLGERQKEAAGAAAGRGSFGQGSLPVPGAHSLGQRREPRNTAVSSLPLLPAILSAGAGIKPLRKGSEGRSWGVEKWEVSPEREWDRTERGCKLRSPPQTPPCCRSPRALPAPEMAKGPRVPASRKLRRGCCRHILPVPRGKSGRQPGAQPERRAEGAAARAGAHGSAAGPTSLPAPWLPTLSQAMALGLCAPWMPPSPCASCPPCT